jgi:hypothetical protein
MQWNGWGMSWGTLGKVRCRAPVAVSLGVGGVAVTNAVVGTGERAVFVPISPCRLFDLRPAPDQVGPRSAPLGPSETYTQAVRGLNGSCDIPADATAVAMNVTAIGGTAGSFLTIWPSDVTPRPVASNLNWVPGSPPTPNKVDVKLSADGKINLFNLAGSVSVLADVVGYYADHNHDDRYYTESESDTQLAAKANAADVYTKAQINGMPSSSVVAGGGVIAAGTISNQFPRFGATWTVSKLGVGAYRVNIPGVNPGCPLPLPLVLLTGISSTAAGFEQVATVSVLCLSGDAHIDVNTFDAFPTVAAADRAFQFIVYRPGDGQLLPASAHPGATECTSQSDGTVECL